MCYSLDIDWNEMRDDKSQGNVSWFNGQPHLPESAPQPQHCMDAK